jgi:hypothetical protein
MKGAAPVSASTQLAAFIGKFDPTIAKRVRDVRAALRKRLPSANELVYDNYNFFVIGYSTTSRPSDCIVSLIASAKGVALGFYYGAGLPDPHKVLLGGGNQHRFVRLASPATLDEPPVAALVREAVVRADPPLASTGRGSLVIRSVSAKQRSRR